MLLPREQSPWNCGYYLGGIALQVLERSNRGLDVEELRDRMQKLLRHPLSANQVVSALVWLFLLDAVTVDDNGKILQCT